MPKQYETMTCSVAGPDLPSTDSASEHLQNRHSLLTDPLEHLELCVQYKATGTRQPLCMRRLWTFYAIPWAHMDSKSAQHIRISLMGFTGSRVWMDMDGYGKTDANGYGKQMQTECCYTWKVQRDSIEKNWRAFLTALNRITGGLCQRNWKVAKQAVALSGPLAAGLNEICGILVPQIATYIIIHTYITMSCDV